MERELSGRYHRPASCLNVSCIALLILMAAAAAVVVAVHVKAWHCQAALAVIQLLFCIGSVYLKSSLLSLSTLGAREFHPIVYAFIREAVAGPIMCLIAYAQSGEPGLSRGLVQVECKRPVWQRHSQTLDLQAESSKLA